MTPSKRAVRPAADAPVRPPRQAAQTAPVSTPAVPAKVASKAAAKTTVEAAVKATTHAGAKATTRTAAITRAKSTDAVAVKVSRTQVGAKTLAVSAARTTSDAVRPRLRAKAVAAEQGLVSGLVHSLQDLPTKLLARLGTASELAAVLVKAQMPKPANKALVDQAAHFLRDLREAAQLSLDDLAKALTLEDASLLSLVESGKVGLPFDIILRMATVLGKNDPVGFVLKVTRAYNPGIWATLDKLGIGKLVVQAGREREFANIYRANEAGRQLNDAEFAAALRFVAAAFDTAVVCQQQANERGGQS